MTSEYVVKQGNFSLKNGDVEMLRCLSEYVHVIIVCNVEQSAVSMRLIIVIFSRLRLSSQSTMLIILRIDLGGSNALIKPVQAPDLVEVASFLTFYQAVLELPPILQQTYPSTPRRTRSKQRWLKPEKR